MKLSLRDVLNFGGLLHATVLAGNDKLDSIFIESVTTIEVTDNLIGDWVKKNQLCITTMYAIRNDLQQQLNLVKILHRKKCAALVVCHVGIWIEQLDDAFISLCQELQLPLIRPNMEVSYLDILNPLIYRLMSKPESENLPYRELDRDILNMIIQGDPLSNIMKKATHYYENKVTYLDSYCNCIYSNKTWKDVEREKTYIHKNFNLVFSHLMQKSFLDSIEALPNRLVYLVQTKTNVLGFLIFDMQECDGQKREQLLQLAETLNTICALVTGRQTRTRQIKEYYIQEYITDLLVWNFRTAQEAVTRGIEAGLKLKDKNHFILINLNSVRNLNNIQKESLVEQLRIEVLPQIRQKMEMIDSEVIVHLYSDQFIILIETDKQKNDIVSYMENSKDLLNRYGISVSIGISEKFNSVEDIPAAYKQATQAYSLGRSYFGEQKTIFYSDIYFFDEILKMKEKDEAIIFSQKILSKLINYDALHQSDLLYTLAMLLMYNADISTVASFMHLHRNTLLYRKNKIVEILGYSPFDMPYSLNFIISLLIYSDHEKFSENKIFL